MIVTIIAIVFAILTLIGIGAWIWAGTHDGPTGLMAFWTIVAAGCLIVSVAYGVHAYNNRSIAQSKVTQTSGKLKGTTYFNARAKQKSAQQKQALREKGILKELRNTYRDDIGTVTFDAANKTYVVQVKKHDYHQALKIVRKYPKQNKKALKTIRASFTDASKAIDKALKQKGYRLVLKDGNRVVLAVRDGVIVRDGLVK